MSDLDQRDLSLLGKPKALEVSNVHWLPGAPLPPALHTGHPSIDFEHAQLLACARSVRDICVSFVDTKDCSDCLTPQRDDCENHLAGLLGDLLAFIMEHFKNEEIVMRQSMLRELDREVCAAHIEDHANISAKIQEIIVALEPVKTVVLLRDLDVLLQRWIANHVMLHDVILDRWLEAHGQSFDFGSPA